MFQTQRVFFVRFSVCTASCAVEVQVKGDKTSLQLKVLMKSSNFFSPLLLLFKL